MSNSIGFKPISKVAAAFAASVLIPAALAGLAALNVADLNWKAVAVAAGSAFVTALTAYLKPFAGNERYQRFE